LDDILKMHLAGVNVGEGHVLEDVDYDADVCVAGFGDEDFLGGGDRADITVWEVRNELVEIVNS